MAKDKNVIFWDHRVFSTRFEKLINSIPMDTYETVFRELMDDLIGEAKRPSYEYS